MTQAIESNASTIAHKIRLKPNDEKSVGTFRNIAQHFQETQKTNAPSGKVNARRLSDYPSGIWSYRSYSLFRNLNFPEALGNILDNTFNFTGSLYDASDGHSYENEKHDGR